MKIVKYLEESGLLIKDVSKTMKKRRLLSISLGTLNASLLGNLLVGKGIITAGEGIIRADQDF